MKRLQEFETNSMFLFCLLMIANVCNYFFQVILGNIMTVEDYGVVNTILGIVAILSVPTTIITMISARYTAMYVSLKNNRSVSSVLKFLFGFTLITAGTLLFVGAIGIKQITGLFGFSVFGYVAGALIISVANLAFSVTAGTLQGLKQFFYYGIQAILLGVGKLVLSIVLVILQFRVYGVITAIFIATLLSFMYGMIHIRSYLSNIWKYNLVNIIDIKEFCKYALAVIMAQGSIIAITNGDVLLVKIYFGDTMTGVYSSASVIGKIAMYVTTAIIAALFPMAVEKNQKNEDTFPLFQKAMIYGGAASVGAALGMNLLGNFVIGILFGERYNKAIPYLPYVCIYIVPLTFLTILMNYVLAVGKVKVFSISIFVGLIGILAMAAVMHSSIEKIMIMSGVILFSIFLVNIIWMLWDRRLD